MRSSRSDRSEKGEEKPAAMPERVLFVFSDVGAGHRAAVRAIDCALAELYPGAFETHAVDIFAECGAFPVNRFPQLYSRMFDLPWLWGLLYRATDSPQRFATLAGLAAPLVAPRWERLLDRLQPQVIVSALPNVNRFIAQLLERRGRLVRFGVVMTELVNIHAAWIAPEADWCTASTDEAAHQAIRKGMPAARVYVTGQPVHPSFQRVCRDRRAARVRLGLDPERYTVLLTAGGAGRGGLEPLLKRLDARAPAAGAWQVLVVCGRNEPLRKRLAGQHWRQSVHIYGFVHNMPDLMAAADVVATKGGSTSLAEALVCGLPVVITSALPGQETGNIGYIEHAGAGVYAPGAEDAAAVIGRLGTDQAAREQMAANARALARPHAAYDIARLVAGRTGRSV